MNKATTYNLPSVVVIGCRLILLAIPSWSCLPSVLPMVCIKSNTMLKHTAEVRPSGWRRKASKERCFIWLFYAIAFSVKIQTSLVRLVCLPMTDCIMNSRKALLSMLSIRKATAMTSSRLYTS